jgi:hypothetical protein
MVPRDVINRAWNCRYCILFYGRYLWGGVYEAGAMTCSITKNRFKNSFNIFGPDVFERFFISLIQKRTKSWTDTTRQKSNVLVGRSEREVPLCFKIMNKVFHNVCLSVKWEIRFLGKWEKRWEEKMALSVC